MTVHWISERADSRIGEVNGVIVKEHREEASVERSARVRAEHEYAVLSMLHLKMSASLSVPRPLSLDGATLTIERATGTPLDVLIREDKRQRNAVALLHEPVRRAGEWLRAMQHGTPASSPAGPQASTPAPTWAGARLRRRIDARLRDLDKLEYTPTGHHGDYWPGNIFIDTHRVQVIDFEGYRTGHPLEDVAYFLLQLTLLMPRHQRLVPQLRRAFLEGYGNTIDEDALQLFTLTKTLHLLARNAPAKHSFLIRIWMRRMLRNVVSGCLR